MLTFTLPFFSVVLLLASTTITTTTAQSNNASYRFFLNKTKMFNGRSFTTTILSLSFILMITIIKASDGSTEVCNHGTTECQVFHKEEQEFLMDTQEHRQILEIAYSDSLNSNGTNGNHITYKGLIPGKQACGSTGCSGKQVVDAGRRCQKSNYSCKS